jgi:phage N-6-adenine-methyltransferase
VNIEACLSSDKMDWRTPEDILELVRRYDSIGLDPCTGPENPTKAAYFFTEADNGLERSWMGRGLVFVNPPYGRAVAKWAAKCAREGGETSVIALLPARPDSRWFHDAVFRQSTAICWLKGRVRFVGAPASAPFPSVLVYWGEDASRFAEAVGARGEITRCS